MRHFSRRRLLQYSVASIVGAAAYVAGKAGLHLYNTGQHDVTSPLALPELFVDDASRLNKTRVNSVLSISGQTKQVEKQLAEIVSEAKHADKRIVLAGSRHTMGGHTIYPQGVVIETADFNQMHLDEQKRLLHVQAGASWQQIIPYLDQKGYSVAVMQSNNDFTVGGTLSANAHGWQTNMPPVGATVESLTLLMADGKKLRCSRDENKQLFSLVIGGYGLFGILVDITLRVVKNESYRSQRHILRTKDYASFFQENIRQNPEIAMAYGRLSVEGGMLDEAMIYSFSRTNEAALPLAQIAPECSMITQLKRLIFRGSAGSDYGKALRWNAEQLLSEQVGKSIFSRNELLNESARNIMNFSQESTDILHEYFIPFDEFYAFTTQLSEVVRKHGADLLNVTVRDVKRDEDAFMRYAAGERLALVLLFTQERTADGERKMQAMTRELIDAAQHIGGSYYLPYRLHATPQQLEAAYPMVREFFALKKHYDPNELFQNAFYRKYNDRFEPLTA